MTIEPDNWTDRKDALRKFLEIEKIRVIDTIVKGGGAPVSEGVSVNSEGLILGVGYDNDQQLPLRYEQRQRIVCDRLLELLIQFTADAATFLEGSEDNIGVLYSRSNLWRMLLNKVSTDLLTIQAAVQQRSAGEEIQPYGEVSRNTLIRADIIAEHALEQAVENEFLDQPLAITYLTENISIREVPYAKVMMIGVGLASVDPGLGVPNEAGKSFSKVSRDMLAIPHEVGHHLYWKGKITKDGPFVSSHLKEQLKQAQIWEWDWRSNWLEEIFADAYGFLVAGPVMACSFQELLTDDPPAKFKVDNGHHPIPALRPCIQTAILRGIIGDTGNPLYTSAPDLLDGLWNSKVGADPLQEDYELYGVLKPVKGQQILDGLDEIIRIVLETLRVLRPPDADANWTHGVWKPWTNDVQNPVVVPNDVQNPVVVPNDVQNPVVPYDELTFEKFFPLKEDWSQDQMAYSPIKEEDWPITIHSGWREKAPEDHGG